jgi:hypothetical protein
LRRGIVGSGHRQQRLRARLSESDYQRFARMLEVLTDEAHALLREAKDATHGRKE